MNNQIQREVEIWQCESCKCIEHHEKEIWCWQCGQGEMIYMGKGWIDAESVSYQPDTRSFMRKLIEFPFRLFHHID